MQKIRWQILLGLFLIFLSGFFYFLHYTIFQDAHHILIFLLSDMAFIPIEVLFVTLIIHKLLNNQEKKHILEKLNMLIGVFFSEIGRTLVADFSDLDENLEDIKKKLIINNSWIKKDFTRLRYDLANHDYKIKDAEINFAELKRFLHKNHDFLINLIENPNLLEHDTFTDLLLAVFHLVEELEHRDNFENLPASDLQHLRGDIQRAYKLLVYEWVIYMQYMKKDYPYLFSLAIRMNPFDKNASVVVKN